MGLEACRVLVEGLDHPEGVTVDSSGTVYAGGEAGQLYRIDMESRKAEEVANTGGFLLGMCADGRGRLYVCDVGRRQVLRIDPEDGAVAVWSNGTPQRPLVNPNWPVFDANGNLYVTDSGTWQGDDGCIVRVDPAGTTTVWSTESTNFPNGACLTADGAALLVLESCTPALVRIPIGPDGRAGARTVVASLTGVPDGVALDTAGNAYICHYRPDRIDRVFPDGRIETVIEDSLGTLLSAPTNGVWIGHERDRLVVGNLGRWHLTVCDVGARGIPLEYPLLP